MNRLIKAFAKSFKEIQINSSPEYNLLKISRLIDCWIELRDLRKSRKNSIKNIPEFVNYLISTEPFRCYKHRFCFGGTQKLRGIEAKNLSFRLSDTKTVFHKSDANESSLEYRYSWWS